MDQPWLATNSAAFSWGRAVRAHVLINLRHIESTAGNLIGLKLPCLLSWRSSATTYKVRLAQICLGLLLPAHMCRTLGIDTTKAFPKLIWTTTLSEGLAVLYCLIWSSVFFSTNGNAATVICSFNCSVTIRIMASSLGHASSWHDVFCKPAKSARQCSVISHA